MATGELSRRVAVAGIGIPLVLGFLWLGGWPLGVLVAAAATVAALEFYRLSQVRGGRPFAVLGAAAAGALVLLATAFPAPHAFALSFLSVVLAVALTALAASTWLRWPGGEPLEAVGSTVLGVLYTGGALAFVPLLRSAFATSYDPATVSVAEGQSLARLFGTACVLLPLLVTWAGDTAAYFAGRAWGKRKLAPVQSPGKTIEGAVAGLVGSMVAAVLVSFLVPPSPFTGGLAPLVAATMGILLGAAGQVGDLAESVLKRQAGVKDSGQILPGHGGMLDRLDSLFFAFPLTWALLLAAGVIRLP